VADLGTITRTEKFPELSAAVDPKAAPSKVTFTVSPAENPLPAAVVRVVGGPTAGETETDAAATKLALARVHMIAMNLERERRVDIDFPQGRTGPSLLQVIAKPGAPVVVRLSRIHHKKVDFFCAKSHRRRVCLEKIPYCFDVVQVIESMGMSSPSARINS
jgi:hypothetical protein